MILADAIAIARQLREALDRARLAAARGVRANASSAPCSGQVSASARAARRLGVVQGGPALTLADVLAGLFAQGRAELAAAAIAELDVAGLARTRVAWRARVDALGPAVTDELVAAPRAMPGPLDDGLEPTEPGRGARARSARVYLGAIADSLAGVDRDEALEIASVAIAAIEDAVPGAVSEFQSLRAALQRPRSFLLIDRSACQRACGWLEESRAREEVAATGRGTRGGRA